MKKIMAFAALMAATGIFASCTKDNEVNGKNQQGDTYAAVTLTMNGNKNMRSEDGTNYNPAGTWAGKDDIKSVDVYLVDANPGNAISHISYSSSDFTQDEASGKLTLTPLHGIKTTAGKKDVYVVINASSEIQTALNKEDRKAFLEAWNNAHSISNISDVAKVGSSKKDVIMMTGSVSSVNIEKDVTEEQALDSRSPKNRASVPVTRVAARVIVTIKSDASSFDVMQTIYGTEGTKTITLGKLSDLKYAVAQGENSFYIQQQIGKNGKIKTPAYDIIPDQSNFLTTITPKYYYGGLEHFTKVLPSKGDVTEDITQEENPFFILPASHAYDTEKKHTTVPAEGGFRRGNTPYVVVTGKFAPTDEAIVDGSQSDLVDGTFYVGTENGRIYAKKENVVNPEKGGREGQKYRTYKEGKVYYFAYVNPDDPVRAETFNAPVFRNNVYRVRINSFTALGYNWNPLQPYTPTEDGKNPNNPDNGTEDPGNIVPSPIQPNNPLYSADIYMSVDVTVVQWNVHSYEVNLGL